MLELNRIYCGDCLDLMREMPDKSVDLTVTSPPYDNLREYKGYAFDFEGTAKELFRITKDGGVVVWVVGDATINGSESGTSFKQALYFKEIGFNLHDTMIYQKRGLPNETDKRYRQDFEYIFIITRGAPNTFNPLLHRKKCTDNRKFKNISKDSSGEYHAGKMNPHAYTKDGNVFFYVASGGNGQSDDIAYEHPATFPEKLAEDQIISWSNEGDLVLDPFNGSGTTAKMAKINQRNFIGIDISQEYCDIAEKRLEKVNNHKITDFFGVSE
jgi:site-specific DNA-methyltransferase (adenine-specific)